MASIYKWLVNGSSRDADVDGSSTPVVFSYVAPARCRIYRMIVFIQDSGTFDAEKYGNGVTLTNGISVKQVYLDASELDLCDGHDVVSNAGWQAMCHDFAHNAIGTGDEVASVRWTFAKAGRPLTLETGESFKVTINDNLTGLEAHYFQIQGVTAV